MKVVWDVPPASHWLLVPQVMWAGIQELQHPLKPPNPHFLKEKPFLTSLIHDGNFFPGIFEL